MALSELKTKFLRSESVPGSAGVPEYWIVNLVDRCVEVYRDPDSAAGYRAQQKFFLGEALASPVFPLLELSVAEILAG